MSLKVLFLISFIFICTACSKKVTLERELEIYKGVFENQLNTTISTKKVNRSELKYPERRELFLPRTTQRVSFNEFFSFADCELNRLVGEHNSLLNQHQGASEILLYDLAFIQLADECLNQRENSEENAELQHLLKTSLSKKRENIATSLWNATIASKEFQKLFSVFDSPISSQDIQPFIKKKKDYERLITAFNQLSNKQAGHLSQSEFDLSLGELRKEKLLGKSLLTMKTISTYLSAVNRSLREANSPICLPEGFVNNQAAPILVFSDLIQLAPLIGQIEQILRPNFVTNEAMSSYWLKHWSRNPKDNVTSTFESFRLQIMEHGMLLDERQSCE